MNASFIRNCGSGTPDFSTIQGATDGTAVGMTSNRGTKSLKCCAESGQAKMAGHSIVRAHVITQAGASILLKLPKCIIVRCTRVPVRIGQNWADCNTEVGDRLPEQSSSLLLRTNAAFDQLGNVATAVTSSA